MICMKIKTELRPADAAGIARGAELLRQGELVALPTETVYGIAADARNGEAVKKIFVAKGRPQDNPLIVHIAGPDMLPGLVSEVPERAQLLMAAFCPGPLTIIMPRGPEVAAECCAGLDTVGIRMPSHPVVQAIIRQSGCAFAAPSANLSGKPSPTNAQDVFTDIPNRCRRSSRQPTATTGRCADCHWPSYWRSAPRARLAAIGATPARQRRVRPLSSAGSAR